MAQLRALCVIQKQKTEEDVLCLRMYPLFEKKARNTHGDSFVPIPRISEFSKLILQKAEFVNKNSYIEGRDSCEISNWRPVYTLNTVSGPLWPCVILDANSTVYCCVPYADGGVTQDQSLHKILGVSVGVTLLVALANAVGPLEGRKEAQRLAKTLELNRFVSIAVPCGIVIDYDLTSLNMLSTMDRNVVGKDDLTRRMSVAKGKNSLTLVISETIRASQHPDLSISRETIQVSGCVICSAALEGSLSEVSFSLISDGSKVRPPTLRSSSLMLSSSSESLTSFSSAFSSPKESADIQMILTHPCVLEADTNTIARTSSRRVKCIPPTQQCSLLYYTSRQLTYLPIVGNYIMDGNNPVNVQVHLWRSHLGRSTFEYCEVHMFLGKNKAVLNLDHVDTSIGNLSISKDGSTIVWSVISQPQRMPEEAILNARATVVDNSISKIDTMIYPEDSTTDIPNNNFASVIFKVNDFTYTGCSIERSSIVVSSPSKPRINVIREMKSAEYKIWNTVGESPLVNKSN